MTITEQSTGLTCQAHPEWIGGGCAAPAVVRITSVCVHEHVSRHAFCAGHAEDIRSLYIGGRIICSTCFDGPEPHECDAYEISSEDLR